MKTLTLRAWIALGVIVLATLSSFLCDQSIGNGTRSTAWP